MYNTPENWLNDIFGEFMTGGWVEAYKGFARLIIKLNAATCLVFLRHQTGTRFISSATLIWGFILIALFWMGDVLIGSANSLTAFTYFGYAFALTALYRIFESRKNLRRRDGKAAKRYGGDTGLSHLWLPFKTLMSSTTIIAKTGEVSHWWQLDEYKFQRFIEPLTLWVIGSFMWTLGYGSFGFFIQFSAVSSFMLMQSMADAFYETKQQKWDAELISGIVSQVDKPVERERGMVVQQSLMRSAKDFDKWRRQHDEKLNHRAHRNQTPHSNRA